MALVDILERITDATAKEIVKSANTMDKAIGERPFGTKQLPERAQVRRYSLIRDDEAVWKKLLDDHGPELTLDYAKRMERLLQKYPEDDLSETAAIIRKATAPPPDMPMGGPPAASPPPASPPPAPIGPVPMAAGGVVTSPTVALLGEQGPEAVVPLTPTDIRGGPDTGSPQPQMPPITTESAYPYTWWLDQWGPPPRWLGDAMANYMRTRIATAQAMQDVTSLPNMPFGTNEAEGSPEVLHNPHFPLTEMEQPPQYYGPPIPPPGPYPHREEWEPVDEQGLTLREIRWLQAYWNWEGAQHPSLRNVQST